VKRLFCYIALAFLAITTYGCAVPVAKMNHSVVVPAVTGPDAGKALVIFMRPDGRAFNTHAIVYHKDTLVGTVPYNSKLAYMVKPGKHTFMAISESADFMNADVVAGKTYYAQIVPRMGWMRARFSFVPISKGDLQTEEVRKWIADSQFVKNADSLYRWDDVHRANVEEKRKKYFPDWDARADSKKPMLRPEDGE